MAALSGSSGLLALGSAAIGLYGVRRTRRAAARGDRDPHALGAQRRDVVRLAPPPHDLATVVGLGIGLGVAAALTRYLEALLIRHHAARISDHLCRRTGNSRSVALIACFLPAHVEHGRSIRWSPCAATSAHILGRLPLDSDRKRELSHLDSEGAYRAGTVRPSMPCAAPRSPHPETLTVAMHGWGISQRVQQMSDGEFAITRVRSIPPSSVSRRTLITSAWDVSDKTARRATTD